MFEDDALPHRGVARSVRQCARACRLMCVCVRARAREHGSCITRPSALCNMQRTARNTALRLRRVHPAGLVCV